MPGPYGIGSTTIPGLAKVIEESGELLQAAGKIMSTDGDPMYWDGSDLAARLVDEIADSLAAIRFLRAHWTLGNPVETNRLIDKRVERKFAKFQHWHWQYERED